MKQSGVGTAVAGWVLNASLFALSGLLILGGKLGALVVAVVAAVAFVWWEHQASHPLTNLRLLRQIPNQLDSTLSQASAGAAKIGLAPHHFNPALVQFLKPAAAASDRGYAAAYLVVVVVSLIGAAVVSHLVRRPAAIVAEATEADVTEVEVDESSEADSGQR